ncbi:MAG: hypothetical protein UT17_C0017G0003 [Candidatus Woesebacteria bacterium GW2011_GWB1_39_10]|uniref:Uncharacterized protein n=1 Tax=Candidatus Woesebacteria bacterium GW2011_GWB1_39_10 TaxID=1618572 RepID=A0A0G0LT31_9BACT|nr:MAG: hypothetical protein UT17_C0017G0003 [Candidatus Woesebacteria bacterium GW2011_GWB1_39_10]
MRNKLALIVIFLPFFLFWIIFTPSLLYACIPDLDYKQTENIFIRTPFEFQIQNRNKYMEIWSSPAETNCAPDIIYIRKDVLVYTPVLIGVIVILSYFLFTRRNR